MSVQKAKELLEKKYPKCFLPYGETPKPLKKGILQDVIAIWPDYAEQISKRDLRRYLTSYVNRPSYFRCIKIGAMRVDLNGTDIQEVTENEYNFTKTQQEKKQRAFLQKKKATVTKGATESKK